MSLFKYFDTDKTECLTIKNIVDIFARGGKSITVSEVKKMLKVLSTVYSSNSTCPVMAR